MPRLAALAFSALILTGCGLFEPDPESWGMPESQGGRAENAKFGTLVEAYLAWHYATHPVDATFDGIHDYDDRLQDFSQGAIAAEITAQRRWLDRVRAIDRDLLSLDAAVDHELLDAAIRAALVDLEEVRSWERDPGLYVGHVSGGLYALAALKFAPPALRMELAIRRLEDVEPVLEAARANLKTPPAILTQLAIDDLEGARTFIEESLGAAFEDVKDEALRKRFEAPRASVLASLEKFGRWLREDLAPRSTATAALGEELFRRKLAAEEMVETPVGALISEGEGLLESTRARMVEVARTLDPDKSPAEVLRDTAADHPPAGELLDAVRAMLEGLKEISREKLFDVPGDADCKVQETPAFRRGTSFASMEIPGPFEKVARDAYYSVTLPEPSWDAARTAEHLRFFNRHALKLISVHEAYPGHYTQFLTLRGLPSKVRRIFGSGAFSEGWAHYLEEVYVDEVEPADPRLRLHQLNMAALRVCRYLVALRMHCRGMTVEDAARFFEEKGLQERAVAEREAKRGAADPMYLVYTLGKMQILHLREECREAWGDAFTLKGFHHRLVATGYPPVRLARKLMLGR